MISNILSQYLSYYQLLSYHSGHHHISLSNRNSLLTVSLLLTLPSFCLCSTQQPQELASSLLHSCADFLFTQENDPKSLRWPIIPLL